MAQLHSFEDTTVGYAKAQSALCSTPPSPVERPNLSGIGSQAYSILARSNEINSDLNAILRHLRGDTVGSGTCGESAEPTGKLEEVSRVQQSTLDRQRDTYQLINELAELLGVNA